MNTNIFAIAQSLCILNSHPRKKESKKRGKKVKFDIQEKKGRDNAQQ